MDNIIYITAERSGRIDSYLAEQISQSRSKIARYIADGYCSVNEKPIDKASYPIFQGDHIQLTLPQSKPCSAVLPQDIPIDIIYQDDSFLAINKAAGMVVHPAAGNEEGTLVNALLYHVKDLSGINGESRPGIVHRLDKDTSGVLLVARNDAAHINISEQIQNRSIQKYYLAIVHGLMKDDVGSIVKPIARHKTDRKRMAVTEYGKYAETHWQVLNTQNNTSLLLLRIITGRTHQIRVHLSSLSRPVVGDIIYNNQNVSKKNRLLLHAYRIQFQHPLTDETISITAELPQDFLADAEKFGYTKKLIYELLNNTEYKI